MSMVAYSSKKYYGLNVIEGSSKIRRAFFFNILSGVYRWDRFIVARP
jgi:hypothetical protein